MRTTLDYYRMFAGWLPTVGSNAGMMNDISFLSMERRQALHSILVSAVERGSISDPDTALEIINRIRH